MTKERKHTLNLTSWELLALEAAINLLAQSGKVEPLSLEALKKKVVAA